METCSKKTGLQRDGITGSVTLHDCDGFPLAEAELKPTAIEGGREAVITGSKTILGPSALRVGRFSAGYKGHSPTPSREVAKPTESYRKPDVRIYYTQLQDAGSATVYFIGEVHNIGLARARRVKVYFTIKDGRGFEVVKDSAETSPDELAPGQSGMFRKRVPLWSAQGYGWHSKAEWSE